MQSVDMPEFLRRRQQLIKQLGVLNSDSVAFGSFGGNDVLELAHCQVEIVIHNDVFELAEMAHFSVGLPQSPGYGGIVVLTAAAQSGL